MDIKITKTTTPKAKPAKGEKLGFGHIFTDHMFTVANAINLIRRFAGNGLNIVKEGTDHAQFVAGNNKALIIDNTKGAVGGILHLDYNTLKNPVGHDIILPNIHFASCQITAITKNLYTNYTKPYNTIMTNKFQ